MVGDMSTLTQPVHNVIGSFKVIFDEKDSHRNPRFCRGLRLNDESCSGASILRNIAFKFDRSVLAKRWSSFSFVEPFGQNKEAIPGSQIRKWRSYAGTRDTSTRFCVPITLRGFLRDLVSSEDGAAQS